MVAICLEKTAISFVLIDFLALEKRSFGFFFMPIIRVPWRRSSARAIVSLIADISPLITLPLLSLPFQIKSICSFQP